MKIYDEKYGKMSREELIYKVYEIVDDAKAKLERLKDDNSDTAYFLSVYFEKAINDFDNAADYLDGLYDEVIICLNN